MVADMACMSQKIDEMIERHRNSTEKVAATDVQPLSLEIKSSDRGTTSGSLPNTE
jgi:hypothetical protein